MQPTPSPAAAAPIRQTPIVGNDMVRQPVVQTMAQPPADQVDLPPVGDNDQPQIDNQSDAPQPPVAPRVHQDHSVATAITVTVIVVTALSTLAVFAYLSS